MAPLRIEVNGDATIYLPPERATLSVAVRSEGEAMDQVIQDVVKASDKVKTILSELAEKDSEGRIASRLQHRI